MEVFEFFEGEAAADAAGTVPLHVFVPVFVLLHAAHIAAIAIADVAHQAFAHRLDQLQALARLQRVLLGEQNAVFGDGTRESCRRRNRAKAAGLDSRLGA